MPDRERGPVSRPPTTTNPHPAATPGEFGSDPNEPGQRDSAIFGRHAWRWCAIRSLDRPALGHCPRCCLCTEHDDCTHPEFAEAVA
jgi:hypothetical protein